MSVIYESLRKLKFRSKGDAARAGTAKRGASARRTRKSASTKKSLLGLLIIAIGVWAFGYYWLDDLKGLAGVHIELPDKPVVISKKMPEPKRIDMKKPTFIPADKTDSPPQPPAPESKQAASSQFLPPEVQAQQDPKGVTPAASPAKPQPQSSSKIAALSEKTAEEKPVVKKASMKSQSKPQVVSPPAKSPATGKKAVKKKQTTTPEDMQLAYAEKSLRISQLVKQIKLSMVSDDKELTEKLLDQLGTVKGKDDNYVLKLKAFWCMQQGDYPSALPLLQKVLYRDAKDLEAGINMAVLEINTDQLQDARKRLRKLKEIYPNNSLIHKLLLQIK